RDRDFFARGVGKDNHFAFFAALQAGNDAIIVESDGAGAKSAIDISVWIENVFNDALSAAIGDAIKLRPNDAAFAVDLMASRAILLEDFRAGSRIGFRELEGAAALVDELLALGID